MGDADVAKLLLSDGLFSNINAKNNVSYSNRLLVISSLLDDLDG